MGAHAAAVAPSTPSGSAKWLARLAIVAAVASFLALLSGALDSILVLGVGLVGLGLLLAGVWWFLSNRGVRRWAGAAAAAAGPAGMVAYYIDHGQLTSIILVLLLAGVASGAARAAMRRSHPPPTGMPEVATPPPTRPYVIMNPRSGGGKVARFGLDAKAEQLGAEVALLSGPEQVDVAGLARAAAADGADLLGVAGGDGTQALVAGIAAERDLPFLVLSAGTRNHFAMDLGLDREHPDAGLDALTSDGVELRIDLGDIGGRTFVNNVSFGAYADIVQSPAYRDDKTGTTLQLLPEILAGHHFARLRVRVDDHPEIDAPTALLVSNNPYGLGDLAGLSRRARLDSGVLGVVAITVDSASRAAGLLNGRRARGVWATRAHQVVVDADAAAVPVGIDGEAVLMSTPVRCTIRPGALRVRVPRDRPGVPLERPPTDWAFVKRQALDLRHLATQDTHIRAAG